MDLVQKTAIKRCRVQLVEDLQIWKMYDAIESGGLMTSLMVEEIKVSFMGIFLNIWRNCNKKSNEMPLSLCWWNSLIIIILRVISVMNIFPHSIAPLKVVDHILQKSLNAPFASLLTKISKQFQLLKHCFQIAPECTILRPCF